MPTRSPILSRPYIAPTATTTPTPSCPMIRGKGFGEACSPFQICTSVEQTPLVSILNRTSSALGKSAPYATPNDAPRLVS